MRSDTYLTVLNNVAFDVSDLLPGVVAYHYVGSNLFAMIVNILIQGDFQVDLTAGKGEALGDQGARKTIGTSSLWSVLQFLNCQLDSASFMALVILVVANPAFDVVFHPKRFALVVVLTLKKGNFEKITAFFFEKKELR